MLPAVLQRMLNDWSRALFPSKCLACDRLFDDGLESESTDGLDRGAASAFGKAMAGFFCPRCRERWRAATSPMCTRCGLIFKSRTGEDHLCGRCLDRPGRFARARAAGIYDGSLRTAIHALKFKGKSVLARPLGEMLSTVYRHHWPAGDIDVIAPVPLHRHRFRRRGFNQAYLLMRWWPLSADGEIDRRLLSRIRDTRPQTGLDRRQRRRNLKDAFIVNRPDRIVGKTVLLVDDVLTTGATVDACAAALMCEGAERVDVLTLARAL